MNTLGSVEESQGPERVSGQICIEGRSQKREHANTLVLLVSVHFYVIVTSVVVLHLSFLAIYSRPGYRLKDPSKWLDTAGVSF